MSFLWPALLALLALIPLGILADRRIAEVRRRRVAKYGSLGIAAPATGRPLGWRRRVPAALFVLGLTVMVVGLARPQAVVSLPRLQGTVILAFDISGSMAATDFAPTRMEAAKAAARSFVQRQPAGVVVGVVAFSDSGLSVQIPTSDQATVIGAIDRLAPQRGTSLGQGILTSLNTIVIAENGPATDYYTNRSPAPSDAPPIRLNKDEAAVIVLLSDGENNEQPDPLVAAKAAADQGVRIETVGIGSPEGTTLEINGFRVHTQLNQDLLQGIADATGGQYHAAQTEPDLQKIYDNLDTHLVVKPQAMEVTSLFAGASILLLVLGGILSLRWLGRVV
jgi:Ca-activated chloride channel family protein